MANGIIGTAVKEMGLTSYIRRTKEAADNQTCEAKVKKKKEARKFILFFGATVKIFLDKKVFTVDQIHNCWSHVENLDGLVMAMTKPPPESWSVELQPLAARGCLFSDSERLDAAKYLHTLKDHVLPSINTTLVDVKYLLQSEGALCHIVKVLQKWTAAHVKFCQSTYSLQSLDLNSLDYGI